MTENNSVVQKIANLITTLRSFDFLQKSDVVDNLSSTNSDVPLSANQGKVLNDLINGKVSSSSLSTVATSGNYDDLLNKPDIPSNTSDLTNDSGFITSSSVPSASSTTPSADTLNGSVGTGVTWARSNHTHPKSSIYAESTHTHEEYIQNQEFYFDGDDFVIISDESTITKTLIIEWDDNDDAKKLRPRYLQVPIGDITAYVSEESDWSVSVPVDNEGSYIWSVPSILGYTMTDSSEINNVTTVILETTKITKTLIVVWNDNDNASGSRPSYLQPSIDGITAYVSEESDWSVSVQVEDEDSTWSIPSVLRYMSPNSNEVDNVTTVTFRIKTGPTPPS